MTPAEEFERFLAQLNAGDMDHLGHRLLERAAQLRQRDLEPPEPEPIFVPALSIWTWIAEDMLRCGHEESLVVDVVTDLAVGVDHLDPVEVQEMLVAAVAGWRLGLRAAA